jgi:DNA repair exonuclease SbcCD ATPase subunit
MQEVNEMKKKIGIVIMVMLSAALFLGALAPLALAEEEGAGAQGQLPPELQEYQGKVQEALASLREPLEQVRALAGELKEGRSAIRSALRDKGRGAAQAFAADLRDLVRESRDAVSEIKGIRSGVRNYRGLKRQVVQAVRDGDTDKAIELIEGALAKVDDARARLDQMVGDLEALKAKQAELLDGINAWTAPQGGESVEPI